MKKKNWTKFKNPVKCAKKFYNCIIGFRKGKQI